MKKLFIVLAVASLGFVACNNEGETKTETDTTLTAPTQDTVVKTTTIDTTGNATDTTVKVDTLKK